MSISFYAFLRAIPQWLPVTLGWDIDRGHEHGWNVYARTTNQEMHHVFTIPKNALYHFVREDGKVIRSATFYLPRNATHIALAARCADGTSSALSEELNLEEEDICRYCRKPKASLSDWDTVPEGGRPDLCWDCGNDAEQGLRLAEARIAELQKETS